MVIHGDIGTTFAIYYLRYVAAGALVATVACGIAHGQTVPPYSQVSPPPPSPSPQYRLPTDTAGDVRPIPDPTSLTTAQLYRELASLRGIIETRLDAMDKALTLLRQLIDKVPTDIDTRVAQLQALHAEKFRSIENQFASSKTALDSALQSSEKSNAEKNALQALAISKAETNVAEQLKGLYSSIQNVEKVISDKVLAIKERQDRQEGQNSGISGSWMALVGVFGIIAVCLSIFGAIRASAQHLEVRSKDNIRGQS